MILIRVEIAIRNSNKTSVIIISNRVGMNCWMMNSNLRKLSLSKKV